MSPASAAPSAVAARAVGPRSPTRSWSVPGSRELLSTTAWPAATASFATVLPIMPLPMNPTVVIQAGTHPAPRSFRGRVLVWALCRGLVRGGRDVRVEQRAGSGRPRGRVLAALPEPAERLAVAEGKRGLQPRAFLDLRQVHHRVHEAGAAARSDMPRGRAQGRLRGAVSFGRGGHIGGGHGLVAVPDLEVMVQARIGHQVLLEVCPVITGLALRRCHRPWLQPCPGSRMPNGLPAPG